MNETEDEQYLKRFAEDLKNPSSQDSCSSRIPDITNSADSENEEGIDSSCIHIIKNKLVRIQYPGIVKNFDKAIDTLGGMSSIEKAVSIHPNKLYLNLHQRNKYNKGCVAECDFDSGLLLKVIVQKPIVGPPKYTYEIVGVTVRNFVFNKLIDFQYLPLVADFPETLDSKVDYIYDSILPKQLPTLDSILKDKTNMPLFLPPIGFSRSDVQRKLNPIEKQTSENTENSGLSNQARKKQCQAFAKPERLSIFYKFGDPDIPRRPTQFVSQIVAKRNYEEHMIKLQRFFEERPIWTRNGIRYNTSISNDLLKLLLPSVAYYVITGPWRSTWIRFAYDPSKDPEARKFQSLDYRVPNPLRSTMKGGRCVTNKVERPKMSKSSLQYKKQMNENSYILRPNMLPATRQVFYQYCDILLPEIQTMLARLPPVPDQTQCDPKNGWFPTSFIDQCREIIDKYIDQQASSELVEIRQDKTKSPVKLEKGVKSTDYCSLMIRNVKRGLYGEVNISNIKTEAVASTSFDTCETASVTEIFDTDSEESIADENLYQEHDLVNEWGNTDGDILINSDQDSIDMDALEDVKKIIQDTRFS